MQSLFQGLEMPVGFPLDEKSDLLLYEGRNGRGGVSVCPTTWGLDNLGKRGIQEATVRKQYDIEAFMREI